jgi:outer membrane protein assembly factor BamD
VRLAGPFLLLWLAACGGPQEERGPLTYTQTARHNYEEGVDQLEDDDCLEAERYFNHVKRKFPYSRYAALSELRLADCDYLQEKYTEAVSGYRQFLRAHPTHPDTDYAAFRIGLSYYRMVPSDWFIVPPSWERDLTSARDARSELGRYLDDYPHGRSRRWAGKLLGKILRLLARHEMYVARYYLDRGVYEGAIGRLQTIFRELHGSGLEPEAMLLLAETYLRMKRTDDARDLLIEVRQSFPGTHQSRRAKYYLDYIGS